MTDIEYILIAGNDPRLRERCDEISDFSEVGDIVTGFTALIQSKWYYNGLAAPQVGLQIRVIVQYVGSTLKQFLNPEIKEFVNPEIIETYGPEISIPEQCLSLGLKNMRIKKRHWGIKIKYQDKKGKYHTDKYFGWNSFELQHEVDHLNGKLITD